MEETALRPVQGSPPRLIPQGGIADTRGGQKERERKFSSRSVGTLLPIYPFTLGVLRSAT